MPSHPGAAGADGAAVDLLRDVGLKTIAEAYLEIQAWGTPEQVVEKLRARREVIGDFHLNACFRFAGIPFDATRRSMELFAERVIPALRNE